MRQVLIALGTCFLLMALNGCALIATGIKQKVTLVTVPPGSEVYINDVLVDTTPCTIKVRRTLRTPPTVEVRKKGYWPEPVPLKKKFNEHAALNFVLIWNWVVDVVSGSVVRYQQPDTIVLKPKKKTK